jgi:long-chain fatty acid transport protein
MMRPRLVFLLSSIGQLTFRALAFVTALFLVCSTRQAVGGTSIFTNGVGARAMSLGGADVAWADDPISALGANPAGLSSLNKIELNLGATAAIPTGHFKNSADGNGNLTEDINIGPDFALGMPIGSTPFSFGIAVFPKAGLAAHWHYIDPPGGLDGKTSYGSHDNTSEIRLLRTAAALSVKLGPMFSLGASLNVDYNENKLVTPYVFQSQPQLRGFKTLLDLSTSGWGLSASTGLMFKPHENFQMGVAYQSPTQLASDGNASGNAGAQLQSLGGGFAGVRHDFHYNAEVDNTFPQMISGGLSWKFLPHWRLALQTDWVNWSSAFDMLPVKLTNGNNRDLNGFLGKNSFQDNIPLHWRDRFVYRAGIEYEVTENFLLRAGYSYSQSPVPNETLIPLTAVIPEHTLTFGAGYKWGRYQIDLAYQWDLPTTRNVNDSSYLSGEYNHTSTQIGVHWIALTTSVRF